MRSELSVREEEVLTLAVKGYTDDMIARELGIEQGTVNSYWVRIRSKLGNYSRTELAARYVQAKADQAQAIERSRIQASDANQKDLLDKANLEINRLKRLLDDKAKEA